MGRRRKPVLSDVVKHVAIVIVELSMDNAVHCVIARAVLRHLHVPYSKCEMYWKNGIMVHYCVYKICYNQQLSPSAERSDWFFQWHFLLELKWRHCDCDRFCEAMRLIFISVEKWTLMTVSFGTRNTSILSKRFYWWLSKESGMDSQPHWNFLFLKNLLVVALSHTP